MGDASPSSATAGATVVRRVPYVVAQGGGEIRYSSYDVLVIGGGIGADGRRRCLPALERGASHQEQL